MKTSIIERKFDFELIKKKKYNLITYFKKVNIPLDGTIFPS